MYVDNALEDVTAPEYVPGSLSMDTGISRKTTRYK